MTKTDAEIAFIGDRTGDTLFRCWELHPYAIRLALSIAETTIDRLVSELAEHRGWSPEEAAFHKAEIVRRADERAAFLVDLASIASEPPGKPN